MAYKISCDSIDTYEKKLKIMTTSLILIFVLGGVIILGSSLTEKAMGSVAAKASSENGFATFSNPQPKLESGKFVQNPTPSGKAVYWKTTGSGPLGGSEQGYVTYDVSSNSGVLGKITFYFINPASGQNSCKVVAPNSLMANCAITQGNAASVTYILCNPSTRCIQ